VRGIGGDGSCGEGCCPWRSPLFLYVVMTASVQPGVLIWMLGESHGIQCTKSAGIAST